MTRNIKIIDGEQWFRKRYVQYYGGLLACLGALAGVMIGLIIS